MRNIKFFYQFLDMQDIAKGILRYLDYCMEREMTCNYLDICWGYCVTRPNTLGCGAPSGLRYAVPIREPLTVPIFQCTSQNTITALDNYLTNAISSLMRPASENRYLLVLKNPVHGMVFAACQLFFAKESANDYANERGFGVISFQDA